MKFIHFLPLHFIFCIFHVNVGVSAKPRSKTSTLPVTSDHINIEPDVNKTILSATENEFKVKESVIEANTTVKSQIYIPIETINHQNEDHKHASKEPDLVTSEVAFGIEEASINPYYESGKGEIDEFSTISSNLYEEIEPTTAAVSTIKYNTTEAPQEKIVLNSRNANSEGEETQKFLPVQVVDLSLISELLNIPRVMQNASMKFSNLRYVFVYNQEPTQNNSLSKVLIKNPEVHTRLNSLQDVDTDLNNSTADHSKTKRTTKLVEFIFSIIKELLQGIWNFLSSRIKRLLPFAFLKRRSNRSNVQKCLNELPPLQN